MRSEYRGKTVVITGGLGFIGSNLACVLAQAGAHVIIIDSVESGCGANFFNIASVRHRVRVICADIGDIHSCAEALKGAETIFNLAGDVSHSRSMQDPERDLALNSQAQLRFLLGCRELCPHVRVVYAGTRQVYGQHERLPVDEDHPIQPVDFNGVHKFAATQYHLLLSRRGDLDCVVLRLSNVYGPRMALHLPQQGFLSVYFRDALEGRPILVYGVGDHVRDPVYVEDVIDAMLRVGAASELRHRVYNIGGPQALSIAEVAAITARLGDRSELVHVPFPEELRSIDIGSYSSNTGRAHADLGWEPENVYGRWYPGDPLVLSQAPWALPALAFVGARRGSGPCGKVQDHVNSMNPAEFTTIARSEHDHWWFRGMRNLLFRLLDPLVAKHVPIRVLDAGSGTGYNARVLTERYAWRTFALDLAWEGLSRTPRTDGVLPVQADVAKIPFRNGSFDALVSLDLLIHLKPGEESQAIREFARVLRPGGLLVIRVAALDILRSRHSEFILERQRFTRRRIVHEISGKGFQVLRCTYANSLLLPIALVKFRLWEPLRGSQARSGTRPVSRWLNRLLYGPLAVEAMVLSSGLNLPLGQSLILFAQKQP